MIGLSNVLRRLVIRKVPCRYDTEFFVGIEAGIGAEAGAGAVTGTGVEAVAGTRTEFTRLRVTYKLCRPFTTPEFESWNVIFLTCLVAAATTTTTTITIATTTFTSTTTTPDSLESSLITAAAKHNHRIFVFTKSHSMGINRSRGPPSS
ncbi:hypothetical protein HZH68_011075 [Vespula germanica]|uniref:Uncharacterized protein n=1 Tax=Vespula germanica TaxID=30212 RepID=A0A834N041_VESGE|nr:hypothetical protein HZH68_011075 [Vespula germanica]